jgi:hypothetical protein
MGQLPTYYDEKFPRFPYANPLILLVEKSPFFVVLREGVFSASPVRGVTDEMV